MAKKFNSLAGTPTGGNSGAAGLVLPVLTHRRRPQIAPANDNRRPVLRHLMQFGQGILARLAWATWIGRD